MGARLLLPIALSCRLLTLFLYHRNSCNYTFAEGHAQGLCVQ